jgi:hypothetical protein
MVLTMMLALAGGAGPATATFPGPQRELPSPDSAYAIVWWGPDAGDTNHSLLLRAPYTRKTWRVYGFARSATVSWAPNEYIFVVTDRQDKDASTPVVVNVTTGDRLVVAFIAPPWGDALDRASGLDLRRTMPPIAEIVDPLARCFGAQRLLCAIQVHETVRARLAGRASPQVRLVVVACLRAERGGGQSRPPAGYPRVDPGGRASRSSSLTSL